MRAYAVAAAALVATNALVPHSARYRRPARCQSWDDDSSARDVGRSRRADDYESALDDYESASLRLRQAERRLVDGPRGDDCGPAPPQGSFAGRGGAAAAARIV